MAEQAWATSDWHFPGPYPQQLSTLDQIKMEKHEPVDYQDGYGPPGGEPYPGATDPATQGMSTFYNMYPVGDQMTTTSDMLHPLNEQVKRDKHALYQHPLYPLLLCLFQKCELATSTPREHNRDGSAPNDVCSASSFKDDIDNFNKMIQTDKPFYVPNRELDQLMIQAIQMLRFHLLELEKVHELCDNFCSRYVTCVKTKMPLDIVGDERASSSQPPMSPLSTGQSTSPSMGTPMSHFQPPYEPQTVPLPENTSSMPHSMEGPSMGYPHSSADHPLAMGGVPLTTVGALQTQPVTAVTSPSSSSVGGIRHDSTPLSGDTPGHQNGNPPSLDSVSEGGDELLSLCGSNEDGRESVMSDGANGSINGQKRKVPKVFSKESITKFRAWLFQNLTHPYPSEDQKKQLANDTGLTILQVNNWFINARRRIVQPMIDQSNRAGRAPNVNVFKNRRRNRSEHSPGPSPDLNTTYSPEANAVAATAMPMGYGSPDLYNMQRSMFQAGPYHGFPNGAMSNPFINPHPMMMGFNPTNPLGNSWMDPLISPPSHME